MLVYAEGVGLVGPGMRDWGTGCAMLKGRQGYSFASTAVAMSDLLPAAERRRAGVPVKLVLAAGQQALAQAARDAALTATVFASSSGDCDNVHHILESLATPEREISPTRFHNSVHNAASGYWSIATQCRAPSTSLCGHDWSFAAGLLEAASQVVTGTGAVMLIAYDHPYPLPLGAVRPICASFGTALVLTSCPTARALAAIEIEFVPCPGEPTAMDDAGLEMVRAGVPAGRSLPVLAALADGKAATVILECTSDAHLRVGVKSCR